MTEPPLTLRVGRKQGRTLYQVEPDGTETLIGVVDTPELAAAIADAVNAASTSQTPPPPWIAAVVRSLETYEATHPKLLFESGAFTGRRIADCPAAILDLVPDSYRHGLPDVVPGTIDFDAFTEHPDQPTPGPQDIPDDQLDALIDRAEHDGLLPYPAAYHLARTAYRVGYAAALGYHITVSEDGDQVHIGDRPPAQDQPEPARTTEYGVFQLYDNGGDALIETYETRAEAEEFAAGIAHTVHTAANAADLPRFEYEIRRRQTWASDWTEVTA